MGSNGEINQLERKQNKAFNKYDKWRVENKMLDLNLYIQAVIENINALSALFERLISRLEKEKKLQSNHMLFTVDKSKM